MKVFDAAQLVASGAVLARLARGRVRRAPLQPAAVPAGVRVSVVIPARDEAARIGPCLAGVGEPHQLLVVDDGSTDATAQVARAHGAEVLTAAPPPPGWVGKPWALQQGLEAATGDVVVCLDADTRPRPGLLGALVASLEQADYVCAGARFDCETPGERLLHPAMLATLVYRFGPPDADAAGRRDRLLVNGQCTAMRREPLLAAGGYAPAAGHLTDDAAFARDLAQRGWRVHFHDGGELLDVDMHASARETWREWGRSIALPGVTASRRQATDVLTVWLTLGFPPLRFLAGRATRLDRFLLALRAVMTAATAPAYTRRGPAYWLSPLADPAAAVRLTSSALRPARRWRGRTYPVAPAAARPSAS